MVHLHGRKLKRRTPQEMREEQVQKLSKVSEMPEPELRKLPTRKRPNNPGHDEGASNLAQAVSESSGARRKLNLPPGLADKFPHLAQR